MDLSEEQTDGIYMAAIVHDIGKINVPAEILSKPSRLNTSEFSVVKTHPQVAHDILSVSAEFPRLTFVNQAYCRYFGKKRDELIGSSFMALVLDEDREFVERQFASLSLENPIVTYEHRAILPDGQIRWQQWTDRALFDQQGCFIELQSVGRDVTEQVQKALSKAICV